MIRITGDIAALIQLAQDTNSLEELKRLLKDLNTYGSDDELDVNTEVIVRDVNLTKRTVEAGYRVYGFDVRPADKPRVIPPTKPSSIGGFNTYQRTGLTNGWSVNT